MNTSIRAFAIDLAERAASTFVQAFVSTIVGTQITSWGEWRQVASAAAISGGAAVLSLLKGVLGGVRTGTASLSKTATAAIEATPAPPAPAVQPAAAAEPVPAAPAPPASQ